jgi:hypothetical protein
MPAPSSFADVFTDVDKLLGALEANADQFPDLDAIRTPLTQALADLRALSIRRDNLAAEKQALSQQLKDALSRVRDLRIELRAALRGKLGTRNEKLVEFKVVPRRKGVKKAKGTTTPEPTTPPAVTPPANPPAATGPAAKA